MNIVPAQTLSQDDMLVRMWLHGRQPNTALAYAADVQRFAAFCGKPLAQVTLADLQDWDASGVALSRATRARRAASVKSLLSFALKMGYIALNPGVALKVEKASSTSAERILTRAEVARMIGAEIDARLRALLRLLYVCGLRASEACGLRWRDMAGTERKGGEARILGKGGKLRSVVVPADLWRELAALTSAPRPESPVVPARNGELLDRAAVHRAVKRAARRAGVNGAASPHWLRHSHASHALDNGCPPHVLQASMGHASLATTTGYLHVKAGEGSASFIKADK